MAVYEIESPNGEVYEIEGPDDVDPSAVIAQLTGAQQQPLSPASDPSSQTYGQVPTDPSLYDQSDARKQALLQGVRETARVVGQGATALAEGVLALPRMVANIPANIANRFGANVPTFPGLQESIPELRPQNRSEEYASSITSALGGALGGMAPGSVLANSANQTVKRVGSVLASNPALQTTGAVSGATSSELAQDAGLGPVGQAVAGIVGGVAPTLASSAAQTATRGAFRGGEQGRRNLQENINSFQRVGTSPSVGQGTEGRVMRGAESFLSRTPGGSGQIISKAEQQADDLARAIEERAAKLVKKTTSEQAGRQIQRSISGDGGFVDRFKAQQEQLYDKLDSFFPKDRRIQVESTRRALKALNQDIEGAKSLSQWFKNSRIRGIWEAFQKDTAAPDTDLSSPVSALHAAKSVNELDSIAERLKIGMDANPTAEQQALENAYFSARQAIASGRAVAPETAQDFGRLPYEAVKKLRTLVGREMADAGIASDVPRSKWKAIYSALSDDLGEAVKGNPAAQSAWNRANNYTRAGMRRIESIESVIDRNGGPEAIFRSATANTKEGATTLRAVMQSVDDEGKKMISATVMRRLGLAKPGVQNELGDRFSTETFLTNWNSLSPEAKRTLFDRYGAKFRQDMDEVAKVASNLREGSQVFKNPSGTTQATTQAATAGAFALAVLSGQVGTAATIAGSVGGANLVARLMVNPRFVRWLARSTRAPVSAFPSSLNALANEAKASGDVDLAVAYELLKDQKQYSQENGERKRQRQQAAN